jgi:ABC-2 type transport system ATP-binding protein
MIAVQGLTKRYGRITAVDRLSFEVRPGQVTGFLGPNGAGKSTTMRVVMGLDAVVIGQGRLLAQTTVAELSRQAASLEDAFLDLTSAAVAYHGRTS